jgi:hypothetical protein
MKKSISFLLGFVLLGMVLSISFAQNQRGPGVTNLPINETTLFAGSGVCARCHERLFQDGIDVSPVSLWRSTMMANAAKDPLWRAKVSAEGTEFPLLKAAIEEKCIKCHSPVLYKQSVFEGLPYSIENLENDPLARDGDTCTGCHQILPDNFGLKESFSGDFMIWRDPPAALRTIFGPYPNPFSGPMINNANYKPEFAYPSADDIINDAEHCATCHNLFTNYVLQNGELSDEKFPEQTPYYEWKNSDYGNPPSGSELLTCQGCHMPQSTSAIKISTVAPGMTDPREPFWYHHFVGGNRFMPTVLKDNIELLGVTATKANFDTTITNTTDLLQNQTVDLFASTAIADAMLNVDVTLTNKAGHKLPTGIPLRRVWIHLKVFKGNNVIFESGAWDAATGEIFGLDLYYETHYDTIDAEDQVQIYEGVMMDDWNNVTRLLLRAKYFVKDNRLPPKGFSTGSSYYDYVKIMGAAANDPDFNGNGSGADTVHYEIPIRPSSGPFTIAIDVCYQTVTPREVDHLTGYDTSEIGLFKDLYTAADKAPVILASLVLSKVQ